MQNQLITEKCELIPEHKLAPPPSTNLFTSVHIPNANDPRHWGVKFEPVLSAFYELKNNTVLAEFGCIEHSEHSFLGASPDGVNVCPNSDVYGRVVEFKCPISRKITGVQKKEYWIQTQLQMEVLGLEECDFVEAKFFQYETHTDFVADSEDDLMYGKSKSGSHKGKALLFILPDRSGLHYEYAPLSACHKHEFDNWTTAIIEAKCAEGFEVMAPFFWRLDEYSCLLVHRDRDWFRQSLPKFRVIWEIILAERITGHAHRAPNSRKNTIVPSARVTCDDVCEICPDDFPDVDPEKWNAEPQIISGKCAFF